MWEIEEIRQALYRVAGGPVAFFVGLWVVGSQA